MGSKISKSINYTYIKRLKRWIACPVCHKRMTFSKEQNGWECGNCEYYISEADYLDDYEFWFCDGCNDYLNNQTGFDRKRARWICTKCGYTNDLSTTNLRGICKDCGALLPNPKSSRCPECKTKRMDNTLLVLETASAVLSTISNLLEENEAKSRTKYEKFPPLEYEYDEPATKPENTRNESTICSRCGCEFNVTSARRSIGRKYGAGSYNDYYPDGDVCEACATEQIGADYAAGQEVKELMGDSWDDD